MKQRWWPERPAMLHIAAFLVRSIHKGRPRLRWHSTMRSPAKRARWDSEGVLDVKGWLADRHGAQQEAVQVAQPVQLGSWTKRGCAFEFGSAAGLLPFRLPRLPLDLNQGREQFIPKVAGDKGDVETVIEAALKAGAPFSDCDVCTFRNNLNKIFGTVFDPAAGWAVDACWRGGTLFLDIVQQEQQWRGDPADAERFTYWGYSFEAACTGQPVADASSEYGALLRAQLGGLRVYLGAEIDCFDPATCAGVCGTQPPGLASYLELKTYRLPQHAKQQYNLHKHRHPKWWLQSFLAGVPTLALGGRDDQGIVSRVDLVKVADLPRISAASQAGWDPNLSLDFGTHCLRWMGAAAAARPGQQLRFSYDGGSRAVRWEVEEAAAAAGAGGLPARLERVLPPLAAAGAAGGGG